MVYGFIVCAGNQSRFKSDTPKALVDIKGKTLLNRNIAAMSPYCDRIFVVCSILNESKFIEKTFLPGEKMVIESGKGSGDAVWQALENLNIKEGDTCYVQWGDSMQRGNIYQLLKDSYKGKTLIPCTLEENPDYEVFPDGAGGVRVNFSEFNEPVNKPGYQGFSLYYCDAYTLKFCLREFHNAIMTEDEEYNHKHDNEMVFLDVFNETKLPAEVLEVRGYKEFYFKTLEQLEEGIQQLKDEDLQ